MPRLMSPFRRRAVPQSAPSLMAALGRRPQQAVMGNILPYSRKLAAGIRQPRRRQQQQQQQQAGSAGAPQLQPLPGSSVLERPAAQQSAAAKPPSLWFQRLAGAAARVVSAAVRIAMAPVQAARAFVPLGHEVYLVAPVHGHGLHAAILEGMQRSLLCPTAHRMPSHR